MKRWSYYELEVVGSYIVEQMKIWGEDGWEAVCIRRPYGSITDHVLFKKPIEERLVMLNVYDKDSLTIPNFPVPVQYVDPETVVRAYRIEPFKKTEVHHGWETVLVLKDGSEMHVQGISWDAPDTVMKKLGLL